MANRPDQARRRVPGLEGLEPRRLLAAQAGTNPAATVAGAFEAILFREPSPADVSYWSGTAARGGQALENQLLRTPERAGLVERLGVDLNGSSQAFADSLYANLLGRAPDPKGEAFWVRAAGSVGNRERIVQDFLESGDFAGVATTTLLAAFPASATPGQPVLLTAGVVPGVGSLAPGGSIAFYQGGTLLGTEPVSDFHATLTTAALPSGSDAIRAVYLGDGHYRTSTSAAATVSISLSSNVATTTTLTAAPTSTTYGAPVTLTARVTSTGPGTPTGTVEFFSSAFAQPFTMMGGLGAPDPIVTAPLVNGVATATFSGLSGGADQVTAVYEGDATFASSTSSPASVSVAPLATTTTVSASAATVGYGSPVTLTATIAPPSGVTPTRGGVEAPFGQVAFYAGGADLGVALTDGSGHASLYTTGLPLGVQQVTAQYLGNPNYTASTSAPATVTVVPYNSYLHVFVSSSNVGHGDPVTITAGVSRWFGGPAPTGTLDFFSGSIDLGTLPLDATGQAQVTTTALPVGTNPIELRYSGDANYAPADDTGRGVLTVVVAPRVYPT